MQNEVVDFANSLEVCKLQETSTHGPYSTWNNITVWSRIDRALFNSLWHHEMGYTHVTYLPEGISDYTPVKVSLKSTPTIKTAYKFYDMWLLDPQFHTILQHKLSKKYPGTKFSNIMLC